MSQNSITPLLIPTTVLKRYSEQRASRLDQASATTSKFKTSSPTTTQWTRIKDRATQNNTYVPYYKCNKAVCFNHYHPPIKNAHKVTDKIRTLFAAQNAINRPAEQERRERWIRRYLRRNSDPFTGCCESCSGEDGATDESASDSDEWSDEDDIMMNVEPEDYSTWSKEEREREVVRLRRQLVELVRSLREEGCRFPNAERDEYGDRYTEIMDKITDLAVRQEKGW